jgi:hypothetical protein
MKLIALGQRQTNSIPCYVGGYSGHDPDLIQPKGIESGLMERRRELRPTGKLKALFDSAYRVMREEKIRENNPNHDPKTCSVCRARLARQILKERSFDR